MWWKQTGWTYSARPTRCLALQAHTSTRNLTHPIYQPVKSIKMNLYKIINEIEKTDPEVYDRLNGRRAALKKFTGMAGKVAAVSLPFMMGSMFKKAYGQTTTDIVGVLNFALTLEYLEFEFYKKAIATAGLIPAADLAGFQTIRDHEEDHVNFL